MPSYAPSLSNLNQPNLISSPILQARTSAMSTLSPVKPIVDVDIRPGGYAIVTITKEPVNSLDLDAWVQLEQALDQLEADPSVSGVIFASGLKRDVFSAGNDIMELYAPKVRGRLALFTGTVPRQGILCLYPCH